MARGKTVALIMAAGSGIRAGGPCPKQFTQLCGKPLLAHTIDHLTMDAIDEIRVVIAADQRDAYRDAIGDRPLPPPIIGGASRQQSVRNGLETLEAEGDVDIVLIHDAARPFVPPAVVDRLLTALQDHPGAVPVLPLTDTLAVAGTYVGDVIDRDSITRIQTPQAFTFEKILAAHRAYAGEMDATDDAQLLRSAGMPVASVPGDIALDKLTFADDFVRAGERLAARLISRTGLGFDVHTFADGAELWLGGIRIDHDRGLSGHSDADVVLHAVTDALLGAIGEGDIGDHFPPTDPQWRGAASSQFIAHARSLVAKRGGRIDHLDVTIICEAPKIGPRRLEIRQSIAALLGIPLQQVSVKATTTERLGFTGRGEGIAAQALATVRTPEE